MPNRTAKFVSAVFASVIAGVPLTATITSTPAPAADECLSAPKGQTPEGSHWYYRIEHPSNRHCWYLREEGDAHAQASSPAPVKQASSKPETAMPGSVANARAELTPRARFDQNATANTGQLPAAANAANIDNTEAASLPGPSVPDSSLTSSVVASRWPNQLAANVPAAPPPATAPVTAPAAPACTRDCQSARRSQGRRSAAAAGRFRRSHRPARRSGRINHEAIRLGHDAAGDRCRRAFGRGSRRERCLFRSASDGATARASAARRLRSGISIAT